MAKHKKSHAHGAPHVEKDESEVRWLISYSDFMMQLVCLFILLYSVSSVDQSKVSKIATAYRASIGLGDPPGADESGEGTRLAMGDRSLVAGDLSGAEIPKDAKVLIEEVPGGWRIGFSEDLFAVGSAEILPSGRLLLDQAVPYLAAYAGRIVVTGTAGETPEDSLRGDAARLAAARAAAATVHLAGAGLDARFIRSVGGAAPTTGEPPAQRGRRVTIVLRVE
jgi:flagellar motor protein MotB